MNTPSHLPAQPRGDYGEHQRAVYLLRAAASSGLSQSEARRQWIRAATQC